jgi:hypothetical protein
MTTAPERHFPDDHEVDQMNRVNLPTITMLTSMN